MSQLKKIIYNCKHATLLIEKKSLGKITFKEEIELRIHLFDCSFCKIYKKQSQVINDLTQELFRSGINSRIKLNDAYKKELQQRIEEELNTN